jgi:hypothetical protein
MLRSRDRSTLLASAQITRNKHSRSECLHASAALRPRLSRSGVETGPSKISISAIRHPGLDRGLTSRGGSAQPLPVGQEARVGHGQLQQVSADAHVIARSNVVLTYLAIVRIPTGCPCREVGVDPAESKLLVGVSRTRRRRRRRRRTMLWIGVRPMPYDGGPEAGSRRSPREPEWAAAEVRSPPILRHCRTRDQLSRAVLALLVDVAIVGGEPPLGRGLLCTLVVSLVVGVGWARPRSSRQCRVRRTSRTASTRCPCTVA